MKQSFFIFIIVFLSACVLLCGCKRSIHSEKEFTEWLNDESNGCVVTKNINDLTLSVYYLPSEYLTYKQAHINGTLDKNVYDSLLNQNKFNLNFLMVFKSDKGENVLYKGVADMTEYSERTANLSFEMEQNIILKTKDTQYNPVLSSLENTYGLSKDAKINIVFSPTVSKDELMKAQDFEFVFDDKNFGMGTVHYYFDKEKIDEHIPEIQFKYK